MTERKSFKKQFMVNGVRLKASVYREKSGAWKIFSVGAVDMPIQLLPFEIQNIALGLVRGPTFETDNQAIAALMDAGK